MKTGGEGCRAGVCSDGMCSCEELEKGGGEACAAGKVCASGKCDSGICTEDEHAKGEALIGCLEEGYTACVSGVSVRRVCICEY